MPHGGTGSCGGSTDDRGELPRQQLRVRAGETRDVVQQSARQTTGFVVPQREADVEVGGGRFRFVCLDAQITHVQRGDREVLESERHLGCRQSGRPEHVLDRGRGAVQRRDVEVAHLSQQPGERHPRFHPGAQDDGVHERPDDRNQLRVPATRHDCGDPHVRLSREAGHGGRECRVQDHELGRSTRGCQVCQVCSDVGVDLEVDRADRARFRPGGGHRGKQSRIEVRESMRPEFGVPATGRRVAFPQRVVDILHRQRRPTRRVADEPCLVRRHEVGHQDRDRRTVRGKVIEFDLERVGPGAVGSEGHTQRDRVVVRVGTSRGPDRRVRAGGVVGVEGAQNFVTFHDVRQCDVQGVRNQRTAQFHPRPQPIPFDATGPTLGPHPLLGPAERQTLRPGARDGSAVGCREPAALDRGGEARDGRLVEQQTQRDLASEPCPQLGHNGRREQGIASDDEEVVQTVHVGPERRGVRLRDQGLGRIRRRAASLPHRLGEPTGVDLAVRGQRDRFRREDGGGDHRRGQPVDERRTQPCRIATLRHDIRVQGMPVTVLARDGDGAPHAGQAPEYGVDLGRFDTHSANLDLVVAPSAEVEHRTGRCLDPPHEVSGPVQAAATRRRDEPLRCPSTVAVVPGGEAVTGQVQLAGHPRRHRLQASIEYDGIDTAGGPSDQRSIGRGQWTRPRREGRRLGRAVPDEEPAPLTPPCRHIVGDPLAAEHQRRKVRERSGGDARRDGRRQASVGDAFGGNQLGEFRPAVGRSGSHHESGARHTRQQHLEQRHVEPGSCDVQDPRIGVRSEDLGEVVTERAEAARREDDRFGVAGRARGEHHVGRVVGVNCRLSQDTGAGRSDVDPFDARRQAHDALGGRHACAYTARFEHQLDSSGRMLRVDHHRSCTGASDRPHRRHRVERARHRTGHPDAGSRASGDQLAGE